MLTNIKWKISDSSISNLGKIMPVPFNGFYIQKNIKLSKYVKKNYLTKFSLPIFL